MKLLQSKLGQFRIVSLAEGLSYILLLGIAMPLKYVWGQPEAVKMMGSLHGFLFVIFVIALIRAAFDRAWGLSRVLLAFFASIVPLGAFFLETSLRKEMDGVEQDRS